MGGTAPSGLDAGHVGFQIVQVAGQLGARYGAVMPRVPRRPTANEIVSLHRYFIWANRMRTHFDEELARNLADPRNGPDPLTIEERLYMSYWYGGLYVVIEGWRSLGLADRTIEVLLESPNVGLLRRYRDGVFHYQRRYYDQKFLDLITKGSDVAIWVRELNREFGRFFLDSIRSSSPPQIAPSA